MSRCSGPERDVHGYVFKQAWVQPIFLGEPPLTQSDYEFTSESVSEGHPDKVCDRISDTVVDMFLAADAASRVACETLVTTDKVVLAGEVRGPASVTREAIIDSAREAIRDIGYEQPGFNWKTVDIEVLLHEQSTDIAAGVDAAGNKDEGAGDQGIMFGFACRETAPLMPAPIHFSHQILKSMADARKAGTEKGFGPDSKSQVTLQYVNGKPLRATSVVVSTQHDDGLEQDEIREMARRHVEKVLPEGWMCPEDHFYVNPTGRFVIGGPVGDAGLTGRKIIVDTYGGAAPHGGGAFSARTRPRLTARRPMRPVGWRRTWLQPGLQTAAPFRFPMRLASRILCLCFSTLTAPGRWMKRSWPPLFRRSSICPLEVSASVWR